VVISGVDKGQGRGDRGKQRMTKILEIDTGTARPGENEPILRKPKT
jgi:cold shock protein